MYVTYSLIHFFFSAILDSDIIDRGRNIVTCSRDGTAKLWDVGQQSCLGTFEEIGGDVNACSIGIPENSIDLGTPNISKSELSHDLGLFIIF